MAPKPRKRNPSSGTISLFEDANGIGVQVELDEVEGTDPRIIEKIRASIAGLSYMFETDSLNVEKIGQVYINGLEEGFRRFRRTDKDERKASKGNYKDSNIGFRVIEEKKPEDDD